jgi:hypothetical protein
MSTTAAFAAPRVLAEAKRLPAREEMLECIDASLEVIQVDKGPLGAAPASALPQWRATRRAPSATSSSTFGLFGESRAESLGRLEQRPRQRSRNIIAASGGEFWVTLTSSKTR